MLLQYNYSLKTAHNKFTPITLYLGTSHRLTTDFGPNSNNYMGDLQHKQSATVFVSIFAFVSVFVFVRVLHARPTHDKHTAK